MAAATLSVNANPINDYFTNRIALTGTLILTNGTNVHATKEPAEPNHAGGAGGASVWWTWTAPANGTLRVATTNSNFDTLLGIYTGSSVSNLTEVASDDDSGGRLTSRVDFSVIGGTEYQIAVDGFNGRAGSILLTLAFAPPPIPPVNDSFTNRLTLTGSSVSITTTNTAATLEPGEPLHADKTGGASVWWTWTAPTNGTVTLTTTNSDFDTLLAVYTGDSISNLVPVAGNDDYFSLQSGLNFIATAGRAYQFAVDGFKGAMGSLFLSLELAPSSPIPPPPNDAFANRTVLSGKNVRTTGSSIGATKEAGEPKHAGNSGGSSVWWTWTAQTSGEVTLTTTNSDFDTVLAVYSGSSVSTLSLVTSDDDSGTDGTSSLTFTAGMGEVYQIAVDGFGGAFGSIALSLSSAPEPNNPPVAVNDSTNTVEDVSVTIQPLVNDSDADGNPLTITSVSPTNGTASTSGANVVFTPATNFVGTATISYSISDGNGGSASALIFVAVTAQTIRPVLRINGSGGNVILSWPTWASEFLLEYSTNLPPAASWFPLTNGVVTVGESFMRTNSVSAPRSFFRLRKQ
jgi:hypothetical protein